MNRSRRVLSLLAVVAIAGSAPDLAAQSAGAATKPKPAATVKPQYERIGWNTLSAFYVDPFSGVASANKAIPGYIWALDSTQVVVTGYILPFEFSGNGVSSFALTESLDSCGYGENMTPTNWISTVMKRGKFAPYGDGYVEVFGRLHVGAVIEDGKLSSLYYLAADSARWAR